MTHVESVSAVQFDESKIKAQRPLWVLRAKHYKSLEDVKIDTEILNRVEIEIRKFTGRRPLKAGESGSEDSLVDELRSAAYLALVRAKESFNPGLGNKFWTYAEHAVRNAIRGAARPKATCVMGGKCRLVEVDEPVAKEGDEALALVDVLPDTDPNPLPESFWRELQPMLPERQFVVLFLRYRRFSRSAIAEQLAITHQRVNQLGQAALANVAKIIATDDAARRKLVATQFYPAEVTAGNQFVQPYNPRAGLPAGLAEIYFQAERWARGSDPEPSAAARKLAPLRKLPAADALYHVQARTWQDAATIIAAQAATELGVKIKKVEGPRPHRAIRELAGFREQA